MVEFGHAYMPPPPHSFHPKDIEVLRHSWKELAEPAAVLRYDLEHLQS